MSQVCLTPHGLLMHVRQKGLTQTNTDSASLYNQILPKFYSLAPRRCGKDFKSVTFKDMLHIEFMSPSNEVALRWMSLDLTDD